MQMTATIITEKMAACSFNLCYILLIIIVHLGTELLNLITGLLSSGGQCTVVTL